MQPTRLLHPWDSPGNSTGVGCHCLLPTMCLPGIILALWCIEMNKTQLALPSWNLHSLEKKKINRLIICQVVISPLKKKMEDYKAVKVKVTQLCPTLCNPMDYTVHGILQARILERVAFPFSRGSSQPRNRTQVFHIAGGFFTS